MSSQQSAWNYTKKSQIAPPPKDVIEIVNESVYGTHLRMLLKMDLRLKIDAKNRKIKIESMRKNHKCVWGTLDDAIQGPPDNTPGIAPEGELQYFYI